MGIPATGIVWDTPQDASGISWDASPSAHALPRTLWDNPMVGAGELGLQAVTSIPTMISKGLTGAVGLLENGRAGMRQTAKNIDAAQDFTYTPQTTSAQFVNKALGKAVEALHQLSLARAEGPITNTMLGKTGVITPPSSETPEQSAGMGAALDFLPQAALAVTPARALARTLAAGGSKLAGMVSPEVQATRVIQNIAGTQEQRQAQAAALRAPVQHDLLEHSVPNSGPTAAQAVSTIPEGTTIQALQRQVSTSPDRGVSVDFARRLKAQQDAQAAAEAERESATAPIRDRALAAAKAGGGVRAINLLGDISQQVTTPLVRGTPVAQDVLAGTASFLRKNTDANGMIDPEALYQFRKTGLGQIIEKAAGTDMNASTFAKVHVARNIQNSIDQGIIAAGGKAWPQYLQEYTARSKPIDAAELATKEMYSPDQPTSVGGASGLQQGVTAPHLISRDMSLINYTLGLRRHLLEKAVTRAVANKLLDPAALADVLDPRAGLVNARKLSQLGTLGGALGVSQNLSPPSE